MLRRLQAVSLTRPFMTSFLHTAPGSIILVMVMYGRPRQMLISGRMLPTETGFILMKAGPGRLITVGDGHLFTMADGCMMMRMVGCGYPATTGLLHG
jgi:hypothetical protein